MFHFKGGYICVVFIINEFITKKLQIVLLFVTFYHDLLKNSQNDTLLVASDQTLLDRC